MLSSARLQKSWRSPVYGFFNATVKVGYERSRKFHEFSCAARKCKGTGKVRRYQDKQDRVATSNLKAHAIKCFGQDAVDVAFMQMPPTAHDGSIFAVFACHNQDPVTVSHKAHTNDETWSAAT